MMKPDNKLFVFKKFSYKLTFFLILAMFFASATADFLIYRYTLKSQFNQLREKLMAIAQSAATVVDPVSLKSIPLTKEGLSSIYYKEIEEKLRQIKTAVTDIKYIYIMLPTQKPGVLQFAVDAVSQGEEASNPGKEYDASRFPQMLEGFNRASADKVLVSDEWGVFLSGYAPIRDKDNNAIAILGVDMNAADVYLVQKEAYRRAVLVFLFGIAIAIIFSILISATVSSQIAELRKGAERIARGELNYQVKVKGADEIAQLASFFNQMSSELQLHIEELKRTTAEKERILKELEIASKIQQSFLPDSMPNIQGIDIAAKTIPARIIGGDFYDFIPITKNKWGIAIADVSGKGVPAALFMALSRTLMRASVAVTASPSETISHANSLILRDSKTNMFVTLFYAVLDLDNFNFKYSNAGHNPPLLISHEDYHVTLLKTQATALGIAEDIKATTEEINFKGGDTLVLYTDGITEALNDKGERFDIERFKDIFTEHNSAKLSAQEMVARAEKEIKLFAGNQPQFDDITIMVIKAL